MALANYSDLQTAVASWLKRSDLMSSIPDFIALAESKLNRRLRLRAMDKITSDVTSISTNLLAFPANTVELMDIALVETDGALSELTLVTQENFYPAYKVTPAKPTAFTVRDQIEFDCVSDQVYSLKIHYLEGFALSVASPTNWLLTNHPDAYLFGALAEAAPFIKDDNRYPMWQNRFDVAIREINAKETRSKAGTLVTDVPATASSSFDIMVGI